MSGDNGNKDKNVFYPLKTTRPESKPAKHHSSLRFAGSAKMPSSRVSERTTVPSKSTQRGNRVAAEAFSEVEGDFIGKTWSSDLYRIASQVRPTKSRILKRAALVSNLRCDLKSAKIADDFARGVGAGSAGKAVAGMRAGAAQE